MHARLARFADEIATGSIHGGRVGCVQIEHPEGKAPFSQSTSTHNTENAKLHRLRQQKFCILRYKQVPLPPRGISLI
ncbi:hypothetical protein CCR75_002081 [Bremia lactucae]|uniref:Uncharacterized protein n=1 Tax=Bremia lactucae TaxID=4779 RepID=A0A976NZC0_BRELC|nr:hypothetical protein CCR75_002081 [Bremia lactucae]